MDDQYARIGAEWCTFDDAIHTYLTSMVYCVISFQTCYVTGPLLVLALFLFLLAADNVNTATL